MLIFGHLGIGSAIARPWSGGLPRRWLFFGMLAPDILDKTLYYGLSWLTGKTGTDLGLICGTRTFGHTALLLILIAFTSIAVRSKAMAALALGMATHLLLDNVGDRFHWKNLYAGPGLSPYDGIRALLWPALGLQFPFSTPANIIEHAKLIDTFLIVTELLGLLLLTWDIWKNRHESEILDFIRARRVFKKLRRRR